MFLIELTYQVPWEEVQEHVVAHRTFLSRYYEAGKLLVSGPRASKTGGLILSLQHSRAEVDTLVNDDPFFQKGIATYQISEFAAVRNHPVLESLRNEGVLQ
jgi:uncharacterized protein YciI